MKQVVNIFKVPLNKGLSDVRYIDIILRFPQIKCYSENNDFINTLHIIIHCTQACHYPPPLQSSHETSPVCIFDLIALVYGACA